MVILDVSRPLAPSTAPWPGDAACSIEPVHTIASGASSNLSVLRTSPHVGTHADAHRHVSDAGAGAGEMPLDAFVGPCQVVRAETGGVDVVTAESLSHVDLGLSPRVLLRTDTHPDSTRWPSGFAGLSTEAADLMIAAGIRLVGIDTPGVDPESAPDLPVHHRLLAAGVAWLENLDLSAVSPGRYELIALPLKIPGADASPVRAVLVSR